MNIGAGLSSPHAGFGPARAFDPLRRAAEQLDHVARAPASPVGMPEGGELGLGADRQPRRTAVARLETHWTRFLHHDLFTVEPGNGEMAAVETSRMTLWQRAAVFARQAIAIIVGIARDVRALVRGALARRRRYLQTMTVYHALRRIDDRTLRDLGFGRSEIRSVAAEASGEAERTRVTRS